MALRGKDLAKSKYQHFVRAVQEVPEWYKNYNFVLIESMDELREAFRDWVIGKSFMSFDTETEGLDPEKDAIVGCSFCLDGKTCYYVPINHYEGDINLGFDGIKYIYDRMTEAKRVFMFNAKFDCRVMEYVGYDPEKYKDLRFLYVTFDMSKVPVFDVAVSVWLADTNQKLPSLKWAALHFLGYTMQHFGEVTEDAENFKFVHPKDACFYAASDALCTYLLVPATMKYFQESKIAGQLDQQVIYPLQHFEQERIWLDVDYLHKIYEEGMNEVNALEQSIYEELGYTINLNSPMQVSQAFNRLGIDTGQKTDSGYMKTGVDDLESLPESIKAKYPLLDKFVKYKTTFKVVSSYIKVLVKEADNRGFIRCNYKTQQVPTGRLASGKDGKNTFFAPINVQSIPKAHVLMHDVFDLHDRTLFDRAKNIINGFEYVPAQYEKGEDGKKVHVIPESTPERTYIGLAEGMNPKMNVRASFSPKIDVTDNIEDCTWVGIDYAAQELRLPSNFSREPVWVSAFTSGGDVHKSTAITIWGEEKYNKDYRKMAKKANFSILYGAMADSFAADSDFNMNMAEAEEFYQSYKAALPTLFAWVDRVERKGRREGTVYTYFGRPRRVRGYYDNRQFAFANRTCVNTTVQGSASDILKIVMCRVWKNVLNNPEYQKDCAFKTTVHDEIDYGVRNTRLNEIVYKIENLMRFTLPEWPVVIDVEVSFGTSWGAMFAQEWDKEQGCYVPKLE